MTRFQRREDAEPLDNTILLLIERKETFYEKEERYTKFSITGHFSNAMDYVLLITPKAFFKPRKIEIQDQIFKENSFNSVSFPHDATL